MQLEWLFWIFFVIWRVVRQNFVNEMLNSKRTMSCTIENGETVAVGDALWLFLALALVNIIFIGDIEW